MTNTEKFRLKRFCLKNASPISHKYLRYVQLNPRREESWIYTDEIQTRLQRFRLKADSRRIPTTLSQYRLKL